MKRMIGKMMMKSLFFTTSALSLALLASEGSVLAQSSGLEGDEIRESKDDAGRISQSIGVIGSGNSAYRPFSFRINNTTFKGQDYANGYQSFNVNMGESGHTLLDAAGNEVSTSFQTLRDSSLVVAVADGYTLDVNVVSTGVDAGGNAIATGVSSVGAQNVQTITEYNTDGSVQRTYNTASYGDFAGALGSDQLSGAPMADLTSGEMIQMVVSGGSIPEGEGVLADDLFGAEGQITYSSGTTNPRTSISALDDGWYARSLESPLFDKVRYSDLVYVNDGKIVAIVEARPAASYSGSPLPGVWATLALCGVVGGYLKRRKAPVQSQAE